MGYLWAVMAFVIWGFGSTVILRAVPLPGPVASLAGCVIGTLAMLAFIRPGRWREIMTLVRTYPWRLAGLGAGFAGCAFTYHWSIKTTTVANAALTHSLQPLLTVLLFVPLWGGGRPTARGFVALVLGLAGLAVLLWPQLSLSGPFLGIALGAASAVFYSWNMVQIPFFNEKVKQDVLLAGVLGTSSIFLLPALAFAGRPVWDFSGVAATIAFGLLNCGLANVFYLRAMRRNVPVGHIGTLAYLEPVVGIVAAAMFLAEPMTAGTVAGGLLILVSGVLVVTDRPQRKTA